MKIKFTKMQGCGNDYVYINCFETQLREPAALARRISDRHFGVGGDGLILIEPEARADARMHMFNADGSEGSMCGNGIRCVAKYIYDHGLIPRERRTALIATGAGLRTVELCVQDGHVARVRVDMGEAVRTGALPEDIRVLGMDLHFIGIDVGNPHAVYFLEDNPALGVSEVEALDFARYGRAFETHPRFPDKVNSEFVRVRSRGEIDFRVWERGSGETLACGTGATAAVAAGIVAGKLDDTVLVHLLGGDLTIRRDLESGHFLMTGPAEEVFEGEYNVQD